MSSTEPNGPKTGDVVSKVMGKEDNGGKAVQKETRKEHTFSGEGEGAGRRPLLSSLDGDRFTGCQRR